jgi:hypothetical protein
MKKRALTQEEIAKSLPAGHRMPVTRREFLAQGLVDGLGFMAVPALVDLFFRPEVVLAEGCAERGGGAAAVNEMGFLVIDGSGGFIQNNELPLDAGGQPLASYNRLGIPDGSLTMDTRFGLPLRVGPYFNTLTTTMSAGAQALTRIGALAVQSGDDTSNSRPGEPGGQSREGPVLRQRPGHAVFRQRWKLGPGVDRDAPLGGQ